MGMKRNVVRRSRQPYEGYPTWATWDLVVNSTNDEDTYNTILSRRNRLRGNRFTASTAKFLGHQLYPCGTSDMGGPSYMADVRWRVVAEAWNDL